MHTSFAAPPAWARLAAGLQIFLPLCAQVLPRGVHLRAQSAPAFAGMNFFLYPLGVIKELDKIKPRPCSEGSCEQPW